MVILLAATPLRWAVALVLACTAVKLCAARSVRPAVKFGVLSYENRKKTDI